MNQCKKLLNNVCATLSLGHLVILEAYKELELHGVHGENNRDRFLFLNRRVRTVVSGDKYILMQVTTLCAPLDADCGNS